MAGTLRLFAKALEFQVREDLGWNSPSEFPGSAGDVVKDDNAGGGVVEVAVATSASCSFASADESRLLVHPAAPMGSAGGTVCFGTPRLRKDQRLVQVAAEQRADLVQDAAEQWADRGLGTGGTPRLRKDQQLVQVPPGAPRVPEGLAVGAGIRYPQAPRAPKGPAGVHLSDVQSVKDLIDVSSM